MKQAELLIYVVTAIVGAAGLAFPLVFPQVFPSLGPDGQVLLGFALSIFTLLVGDRLASAQREHASYARLDQKVSEIVQKLPDTYYLREIPFATDAMVYIADNLPRCKAVLNTRMAPEAIEAHGVARTMFGTAMKDSIRHGTRWRDVLSAQFEEAGQACLADLADAKGSYKYFLVDCSAPTINFIVMDYGAGHREVVFGWIMSRLHQDDRPAYLSADQRLVRFFESVHEHLIATAHAKDK